MTPPDPLPLPDAPTTRICVGFSGGLDSTVLLHALHTVAAARGLHLRALHVDHGLHSDSAAWARRCQAACETWDVPCEVARVQVARSGEGLEAAARAARFAVFAQNLRQGETLALAHHADDQAETFLMRALRGSGVDGLAGMRVQRHFGSLPVWRPLLALPRARLVAYAQMHGLSWIDDPSNDDVSLDRNWVRHALMPLLRERWPHAAASLARSAALCDEAASQLHEQDLASLAACIEGGRDIVSRTRLLEMDAARRARVLRAWVALLGLPPLPAQGIVQIENAVLHAPRDASPAFSWRGVRIEAWRDLLHAGTDLPPLPPHWHAQWNGDAPLPLPDGGTLALHGAPHFPAPVRVHARAGGERIRLPGRTHSHALKHVLQDSDVPPWLRRRLPLLSDDEGLLAAGDLIHSERFDRWLRATGAYLKWKTDPAD